MIYSGKKAVVLGLGHSGEAAALLLREEGADVTVCESCDNASLREKAAKLRARGIEVILGGDAERDPATYDVCVLSPGIDPGVSLVRNVLGLITRRDSTLNATVPPRLRLRTAG